MPPASHTISSAAVSPRAGAKSMPSAATISPKRW
jgi:hypothetical protein